MKLIELTDQQKAVGFRLPQQSLTKLDESAKRIGISRADLMRDIVSTYLEFVEEHPGDEVSKACCRRNSEIAGRPAPMLVGGRLACCQHRPSTLLVCASSVNLTRRNLMPYDARFHNHNDVLLT